MKSQVKTIAWLFSNVLFLFAAMTATVFGQAGSSAITGTVKDPSDAPIPGVRVRVLSLETGVLVDTITNDEGVFRISALVPGTYNLQAELPGFSKLTRGPLTLQISQTLTIDLPLQIGEVSSSISVTDAAPLMQSSSSDIGQTIDRQKLEALPLPNRAASSLAALTPGVVMIDTGTGTAENYPVFSVAGGRARNQTFLLDGGNATNAVGLTRAQQLVSLPVDAMQEFKVIANNYAAEFGHSTGGVVTMSTRAGTNDFHGSVFESLRNDALDARNFFAARKAPIHLNQFGGTLGGPIAKDRTHFFATWEQTRQKTSDTKTFTVPTLSNRSGDFSDLRTTSGNPITIYDPATTVTTTAGNSLVFSRSPFFGNVIPQDRIDPVAGAALKYYPLPNRQATSTNGSNYVGTTVNSLDRNIVMGRVDHRLGENDRLTGRYYINDSGTNATGYYGIPFSDPAGDITDVRIQSVLGAYTHVFNSSLVNELRFTYLRRKFIDTRPGNGENLAAQIGLTGISDAAFPGFTIPGYATLGNPTAVSRTQTPILDRQIVESLSWTRGKHAFKFGTEGRFGANSEIRDRGSSGNFTTTPLITSLPGVADSGNAFASFLLGEVNAANIQISDKISTRATYWGFFVQDDWRLTRNLTVNLGLRYDLELPRRAVGNTMNSFDPTKVNPVSGTPGVVTFAGVNGVPERAFATDTNNIGPRVGFAYRLGGKTLVRGGAGIFYAQTVDATIGDAAALGFSTTAAFGVPQAALQSALLLRNGFPAVTRPALTDAFGAVPLTQPTNTTVSFFNPEQVAPVSYQYNLNIQRELSANLLVEIGYMGNVSHHLNGPDFSLNQVPPQLVASGTTSLRANRPFPQFTDVRWINPSLGNSTYHGAFVRAEKRFSHGLAFLAHYTFSKFLDDVEATTEYGATGSYMNAYNRRLDKGLSSSDVPHHILVTLQYEIPAFAFGRNNRLLNGALRGWKLGVVETYMSGPVFTVITASNTASGVFPAGTLRPDLLHDPELPSGQRTVARWFDTTAFVQPAPLVFGTSPRSVLRGAPIVTTDMTIEKSFHLSERVKFDVRSEFYNLLNHSNFNVPGFTLGANDFGVVTSARPGRNAQLAARLSF